MSGSKHRVFYILYGIAATVAFLYFLFPSEKISRYAETRLAGQLPEATVTIGSVRPAFPPGLTFSQVIITHQDRRIIEAEWLKVEPNILSMFRSEKILKFKGRMYQGNLKGKVKLPGGNGEGQLSVDTDFADIRIETIAAAQEIPGYQLSGMLDGQIRFNRQGARRSGTATIGITDSKVVLKSPVFEIDNVAFNFIKLEADLKNQTLQIQSCDLMGPQLDGSISGSVNLKSPVGESVLNLNGNFKPHHVFLATLKENLPAPLFNPQRAGDEGFPVGLTGRLNDPGFRFR